MCQDLKDLKKKLEDEIVRLSRQAAHSMGDLDAAIDCVAKEADRRFRAIEKRLEQLERK
jgi:hypothetical protein